MPIERETIVERPASSESIVVGGGGPFGVFLGISAAVAAVLLVLWLVNGKISGNGSSVSVDLPEVTVTD